MLERCGFVTNQLASWTGSIWEDESCNLIGWAAAGRGHTEGVVVFQSDSTLPGHYRIVHTQGAVFVSEFPGHSGYDVFIILVKIRPDLEVFDVALNIEDHLKTLKE